MTALLVLLHVLQAIGHGFTCWAETHGTWIECLCRKP